MVPTDQYKIIKMEIKLNKTRKTLAAIRPRKGFAQPSKGLINVHTFLTTPIP
jgi:hypothetical protein